jgi:hypothetical protein
MGYPAFLNASHAALCVACQGARSHPVPVALVGGFMPVPSLDDLVGADQH